MPKFLAVHTMPAPMKMEDITPMVQQLLKGERVEAYWVKAFGQMDEEGRAHKIFCEWNAKDAEAVKKVFAKVPDFPLDGVYPLTVVDSEEIRSL
jgi:hypothetical protein